MNNRFFAIYLICTLVSCSQNRPEYKLPDFSEEVDCEFELIGDEITFFPKDIEIKGDYIIATGFESETGNTLFVFDKSAGTLLRKGIKKGRGPSETMLGYRDICMSGDSVVYHDILESVRMTFSLEDFLSKNSFPVIKRKLDLPQWKKSFVDCPDGRMAILRSKGYQSPDTIPVRSVIIRDPDGEEYSYDEDPLDDPQRTFIGSLFARMEVSPSSERLALISSLGLVTEIFDIRDGIRLIHREYYIPPEFKVVGGSYELLPGYRYGMNHTCSDAEHIYVAYDGDNVFPNRSLLKFKNVALFDWNGNPEKLYKTEYEIYALAIDNFAGHLYALLDTGEGGYRLGRLRI